MQLGANPVEFVFDINGLLFLGAGKPRPNRLRRRFGTGQHALDWAKQGKLRALQFALGGQERGRADIAQEHVCLFDFIEWRIESQRDRFLDQPFAQTDP